MKGWKTLVFYSLVAWANAEGKDGPIDWEKTPSGGPSTLRYCAREAYSKYNNQAPHKYKGCELISCVCRPGFMDSIREHIIEVVKSFCGEEDVQVDIDAAIKIYNDFCSSNGWPVPGYTYVVTKTAPPPEETSAEAALTTSPPLSSDAPITDPVGSTESILTNIATDVTPIIITLTPTFDIPPVMTETARVTILLASAALRREVSPWLRTLGRLIAIPINFILAIPDSVIVTVTRPPPPTLMTSVVYITPSKVPTAVDVSTQIVSYTPYVPSDTVDTYSAPDAGVPTGDGGENNGNDGNTNDQGEGRNPGPTTLEIVGIVIGILVGVITMIATIWVCARGSRRNIFVGHNPR